MSERKTTEIKIRVTPSFKARVQQAATDAGLSVAAYIEDACSQQATRGRINDWVANDPVVAALAEPDQTSDAWVSGGHGKFETPVTVVQTKTPDAVEPNAAPRDSGLPKTFDDEYKPWRFSR